MKIAHISDLHFSSSLFVQEYADNVARTIQQEGPDLLVVTGDLTTDGYVAEYEAAKRFLDRLEVKDRLIVPGNHDARNLGYTIFEEIIGPRFPLYHGEEVTVVGLDSTEPDVDDGHVGREHYDDIRNHLSGRGVRIVALHHHLIPIPGTGRERQIPTDAGDLLGICKEAGVDIVLSGHKHLAWVWNLDGCFFITAATSTSRRLKGRSRPAMNIMDIEGRELMVREIRTDDRHEEVVLRARLRDRSVTSP
ncbi:MAG: metallophosphoesterase family protein [Methanomassiliicoccus sp.]|nr:metallophosphoesterase family protein [Methanomassiliicoccus sp.]